MSPENTSTPLRVLVVDDEFPIAFSLARVLERAGYESETALNADQAMEVASSFRPDLLLTDYDMPGLNGFELGKSMKRLLPGCKVMLLSGRELRVTSRPYVDEGYKFPLLSKPMDPAMLLKALKEDDPAECTEPPRLKILHVDDVESHRYSVTRLLKHAGFEVCNASTGAEAIAQALDESPDLVLLDIHLPDMNGFEVCRRLKESPATAATTVVHLTATAVDPDSAKQSMQAGADGFMTEPFIPAELIARLRSFIQVRYLSQS
jgi:CheY-like chemotaxis protein